MEVGRLDTTGKSGAPSIVGTGQGRRRVLPTLDLASLIGRCRWGADLTDPPDSQGAPPNINSSRLHAMALDRTGVRG